MGFYMAKGDELTWDRGFFVPLYPETFLLKTNQAIKGEFKGGLGQREMGERKGSV